MKALIIVSNTWVSGLRIWKFEVSPYADYNGLSTDVWFAGRYNNILEFERGISGGEYQNLWVSFQYFVFSFFFSNAATQWFIENDEA